MSNSRMSNSRMSQAATLAADADRFVSTKAHSRSSRKARKGSLAGAGNLTMSFEKCSIETAVPSTKCEVEKDYEQHMENHMTLSRLS